MKPLKSLHLAWLIPVWILGIAFAVYALTPEEGEYDRSLNNRFGDVQWDHELHARGAVSNCNICHHTSKTGEADPPACAECHKRPDVSDPIRLPDPSQPTELAKADGKTEVPDRRTAFHKKCAGCHAAMKGPTACRDCHSQLLAAEGGATRFDHIRYANEHGMACTACHEKDKPTEVHGKVFSDCVSCHTEGYAHFQAAGRMDFDHTPLFRGDPSEVAWNHRIHKLERFADMDCIRCHHKETAEAADPKKETDEDADPQKKTNKSPNPQTYRPCSACHLGDLQIAAGVTVEGASAPPRKRALHFACLGCHDSKAKGLPESMPVACNGCHRENLHNAKSEFGPILWSHNAHAAAAGVDCTHCHHTVPDGPYESCRNCHFEGKLLKPSEMRSLSHTNCAHCHDLKRSDVADMAKWCDIKTCKACHVTEGQGDGGTRSKVYLAEHEKLTMQNAMHKVCWDCHKAKDKGPHETDCRSCHAYSRARLLAHQAEPAEDGAEPLKPADVNHVSDEAYRIHRVHIDTAGTPCADCHHNMRPTASMEAKLKNLPEPDMSACRVGANYDDCLPGIDQPQSCANCHGAERLPELSPDDLAKEMLCNACHSDMGIAPAVE